MRHFAEALGEEAGRALARPRTPREWAELVLSAVGIVPGCRTATEVLRLAAALLARDFKALGLDLLRLLPFELLPRGRWTLLALRIGHKIHKVKAAAHLGVRVAQRAALLAA